MANGPVLVVDFGAQYAQLIARRVREAGVYSELVPHSMPVDEILAKDPKAIILSGGPASVFEPGAPTIDTKVFESGVPVLGICYGFQVMAYELGGKVDKAALGEYGKTSATIDDAAGILADSPAEQTTWMSHGVAVEQAPAGFEVLAHTEGAPVAAMADESRKLYGVQWHPEVKHSPLGQKLIENFLHRCAALPNDWDASSIIEDQVKKIREQVGDAEVICGLSGGVDSAVAAALVHKAIGDQLTCVFVDHGLLRKGEVEQVKHDFVAATGIRLITVDAADDFLDALAGVSEPERKRKIIGEITKERLDLLREADAIAREELSKAGLDRDIWQCPVVLLADVHSVGVQGDERTYGSPIVLRPVSSEDAMTADWSRVPYDVLATISTRITNECRQINRVVLDCTSKPPATIEWE